MSLRIKLKQDIFAFNNFHPSVGKTGAYPSVTKFRTPLEGQTTTLPTKVRPVANVLKHLYP